MKHIAMCSFGKDSMAMLYTQILYKVSSTLNKSIYYIILNQAQIDMIIEGKDNA